MDKRGRIDTADDGTHTFVCLADRLGGPVPTEAHPFACGFESSGWATKKAAQARGEEHTAEHDTREPAPELVDTAAARP